MDIRAIRNKLQMGGSIFELPLRVTFYARVSTDKDEQLNSLENQVQYYTELIKSRPCWSFIPGYIDEGISGTSTKGRESFNRMLSDARSGCFDFIITKEISRFSRSTLDSIKYTQELLEHGVGVLFQNDNINTLDSDSEFRLVVMAGVAQDEVRKLSERLKFGFRQAIKNGRVLGNDSLWGYDKKNCVLTINEREAEAVRMIFDLYANKGLGVRKISLALFDMGYASREGNEFNCATIRHILTNPKYKGWYCGNKSQTIDYRTKRKLRLDESEWVTYPDPAIPAIVSEELWDRANALYRERSRKSLEHASGSGNRYAYSSKIICEEHAASFHRQVLKSCRGEAEVWQCGVYRRRGRQGCAAPQLYTDDLNAVMCRVLSWVIRDKSAVIEAILEILQSLPRNSEQGSIRRLKEELKQLKAKKEHLLELSIAGAVSVSEFQKRNDGFNAAAKRLESRITAAEREKTASALAENADEIRAELEKALSFDEEISSKLAASVLEKITVHRESDREKVYLDILLKNGLSCEATYHPAKSSFADSPSRNITLRPPSRRT